jgi:hypothetical protein
MIFNNDEVNLPERLLQALTSDRLVVFVGAGVSAKAYPAQPADTFYPNFADLAHQIAVRLTRKPSADEEKYIDEGFIDRVLGEWDDDSGDVRRHAAGILTVNEPGQRIDLHRSIVRLFAGDLTPRVVTTNFDRLLVRARDAEGFATDMRWRISLAPSLPPAKRFQGICCLHGTVDDPAEMVLTDKDIGRAYMDENWALRFAHAMFQNFDVLFIGYSLEDPPLRYLSLALEGATRQARWALVPDPLGTADKVRVERMWKRRHVEPIWYRANAGDYRALERTISDWGADNARTFINRKGVLSEFGKAKPDHLPPHELSRARFFLQDPPSLRDFAKDPLDVGWYDRLEEWGCLDFVLKANGAEKETDSVLLNRLVQWIASDPTGMLGKILKYRLTLQPAFFDEFCRVYEGGAVTVDRKSLLQILEFLRPAIERGSPIRFGFLFVEKLLARLFDEGYVEYGIWLFTRCFDTRSTVTTGPSFAKQYANLEGQDTSALPETELRYDLGFVDQLSDHRAKELFAKVLRSRVTSIGGPLIHALTLKLVEISSFERLEGDLESHHKRSAIEPNDQDRYRHSPQDAVLDLLRDCWEALLVVDRRAAGKVAEGWKSITHGLVERLAIHATRRLLETDAS